MTDWGALNRLNSLRPGTKNEANERLIVNDIGSTETSVKYGLK